MKGDSGSVRLEVLSPLSEVTITKENAARLATLSGKTICEVWATGQWGADRTFPVIREVLKKRFPNTKFIPYTEFPLGHVWAPLDNIAEILKAKGCDAVLLGNGG